MRVPAAAALILMLQCHAGAAPLRIEQSVATDVNTTGDVVGETRYSDGTRRAVLSRDGIVSELGTLGGGESYATAVNEQGTIIGASLTAANEWHGFVYRVGHGMRDLGTLGGRGSHAVALGSKNHVVGYADTEDGAYQAFVFDGSRMTGLGTLGGRNSYATAVNMHGDVVGAAHNAQGYRRAFLYRLATGMVELPTLGGRASVAMAINDRGMVVGAAETADRRWHAFLYDGAKMIDLGARISRGDTFATGISRDGKIVGTIRVNDYKSYSFVYDKGATRILPNLRADGIVSKITDDGQFVGASAMRGKFQAGALRTGERSAQMTEREKFELVTNTLFFVATITWVLWQVGPDVRAWWLRRRQNPGQSPVSRQPSM
ncbi:MAG TPA: HAF repeat-containing protein [Pseudoduganella sp.]|jgi:probable HAF family extracellular repeat protein